MPRRKATAKGIAAAVGAGMLAGAAVMMMVPKRSAVYQAADDAAHTIKRKVTDVVDDMMH